MKALSSGGSFPPDSFDVDLIAHARTGLARVHQSIAKQSIEETKKQKHVSKNNNSSDKEVVTLPKTAKDKEKTNSNQKNDGKKTIKYISIKEPPKRTAFYEHSKQGMKYWYDDRQSKRFLSKNVLGRTGTLLGLVDSPYK
ncbi:uncharacterized protein LOC120342993 isoform X1 [Styela clava]